MPSRTVRVTLFATARQAVGRATLERTVPREGVPVSDFVFELLREYPGLRAVLRVSRLVRNGNYLRGVEGRVEPGDELAIHPPYSGG